MTEPLHMLNSLLNSLDGNDIISVLWKFFHFLEYDIVEYSVTMFAFFL